MNQNKENTNEDTPFNMAMLFYYTLNQLMSDKDKVAIVGDLSGWYNCLRAIYRKIIFKINKKEKEDLDAKFKEVANQLSTRVHGSIQKQVDEMVSQKAAEILDQIDCDIMMILHKNRMIFPNVKKFDMDDVRKNFGLGGVNESSNN